MSETLDAEIVSDEGGRNVSDADLDGYCRPENAGPNPFAGRAGLPVPVAGSVAPTTIAKREPGGPLVSRTTDEEFELEIARLIPQAGTIQLTDAQKTTLYAPVPEDIVEIRPDGLIYLPWMEYVDRMSKAFGMSWSIVPKGGPKMNPTKNGILWGFYLIVDGKLAGFAIGEQAYYENNPGMMWGDAVEGAKSNALMRLCKGIGIGLELWRPSFVRSWKEKYAETYWDAKKGKNLWRRKDRQTENGDKDEAAYPADQRVAEPEPPAKAPLSITIKLSDGTTVTETLTAVYKRFESIKKHLTEPVYRAALGQYGYTKKSEIPHGEIPRVWTGLVECAKLKGGVKK